MYLTEIITSFKRKFKGLKLKGNLLTKICPICLQVVGLKYQHLRAVQAGEVGVGVEVWVGGYMTRFWGAGEGKTFLALK